jgi:Skp family chaperone for outer membrane proteins
MGIALSILLKGLGFGKMLLGFAWDVIKGIFKFAVAKPFQFLTIVLSLALIYAGWYAYGTNQELVETRKIVEEKILFIKGQDKILKEYVQALDTEKKNHQTSIKRSNEAVADLKKAADRALANAQAAGRRAEKDKAKFEQLGRDYGRANDHTKPAQERIDREQATNDEFIKDWRKAK